MPLFIRCFRVIRARRHGRTGSDRCDESALELRPALFVPLPARRDRAAHRQARAIDLRARYDRTGGLRARRGRRPREDRRAIARAFVAKAVLGFPTTRALIERLIVDASLRRICGWDRRAEIPSEPTFSWAFQEFAEEGLIDRIHKALVERSLEGHIVGVVARDATEIEAREKPAAKDDELPPPPPAPPRKPGRPRKDEPAPSRSLSRLERQPGQTLAQMCADLPIQCDVGTKKNSKGFKESWTGYKAHIDVACGQIPVSRILTAASLHDSQVAIPLMTMTAERIDYLYEVMDAAYDAEAIHQHSQTCGRVAVIDPNYRADRALAEQWAAEVKRRSFINMPDFDDLIYDFRTMAERVNARSKDEFGGRFVRVRGAVKVKCHKNSAAPRILKEAHRSGICPVLSTLEP